MFEYIIQFYPSSIEKYYKIRENFNFDAVFCFVIEFVITGADPKRQAEELKRELKQCDPAGNIIYDNNCPMYWTKAFSFPVVGFF